MKHRYNIVKDALNLFEEVQMYVILHYNFESLNLSIF